MKIVNIRHLWPEEAGFTLERARGSGDHVLLHFLNPVDLLYRGSVVTTQADAMIVFSPDCPQWFRSRLPLVHDWAHVAGDISEALAAAGLSADTLYYPSNGAAVTEIMEKIELEFLSGKRFSEELGDLLLRELFLRVSRGLDAGRAAVTVRPDLAEAFRTVRAEMMSHPEKPWKTEELSSSVHLSESRFYAVYRQLFGISPHKDRILARVEKARRLLATGRYSNARIAELTGYGNEYHFIRQFRSVTGGPPQKFSKMQ